MPKIPSKVIDAVFYLYASRGDALAGRNPGGTGFLVHYNGYGSQSVPPGQVYAVTNWHVACREWSVIRLNKQDGGIDVVDLGPEDWQFLPGKCDVAAVPASLDPKIHIVSAIPTSIFARPPRGFEPQIGVGEDVFMIGLFIDHDGIATNVPSARFGNVSMLPNSKATIEQPTGYRGESYIVDMHSRTGFSGSPVFAYRTFGSDLTETGGHRFDDLLIDNLNQRLHSGSPFSGKLKTAPLFQLIGIHWGQFPERWELRERSALKEAYRKDLIVEGAYVEGMSGMTCVIPAWQIMEVFDMAELKGPREAFFAASAERLKRRMVPKT